MAHLTRIEKSAFRRGEYVGYACGVWHIHKCSTSYGRWAARLRDCGTGFTLYAWRLSEMNDKLDTYDATTLAAVRAAVAR